MERRQALSLPVARVLVIVVYATALVVYPAIGAMVKLPKALAPQTGQLLGIILLSVGGFEYLLSLWLERRLLARAAERGDPQAAVVSAAMVVAAMGESLSLFGLVLALLSANAWALALYALCLLHGIHLALRWPDYEYAAQQAPRT